MAIFQRFRELSLDSFLQGELTLTCKGISSGGCWYKVWKELLITGSPICARSILVKLGSHINPQREPKDGPLLGSKGCFIAARLPYLCQQK
jgi:hypothetical protein